MIEYQQKYIDDAGELIAKLETELINFEHDIKNDAIVHELFRVMHTLKGTSGMFGFQKIEAFTHILEDIYDLIRNKQLKINKEILDLTFESVDLLKLLLYSKENLDDEQQQKYLKTIEIGKKYATSEFVNSTNNEELTDIKKDVLLYRVLFRPLSNILLRGIKPDGIIEELSNLGKHFKFQFTDATIEMVEKESFNQYWEFFISGVSKHNDIAEVFMFFDESEFEIEALSEITEHSFDAFLSRSVSLKNNIPIDDLKKQIREILVIPEKRLPKNIGKAIENSIKTVISTNTDDSIRVPARKLDNLLNLISELIIVHAQFENHAIRFKDELLQKTVNDLSKISRNFRDEILSTRLIPIEVLSTSMQRLVRDLAPKLGKEIELIIEGAQTELDKNIISRIESPIMHIIRNCIDHGIETPDERLKNDKQKCGVIRFIAFYSGASVFIQLQDDGRGIDKKKIVEKAINKGYIKYDAVLTTQQIYELIFMPGFSTVAEITEVSGRGVGLDVVKNVITDLHGEINIDSEPGLGTSFTIKLPLTLSIVDALLVNCFTYKILIPTSNILFCKYIPSDFFIGKDLQYEYNKKCVPVKRLSELFASTTQINEFEVLIIISIYEKQYGLLVDRIITSLQAVIKPLGRLHRDEPYFIGASELGDGSMAYILDTNFLLKTQ